MRFLIDEMFSRDVARQLTEKGHEAAHVADLALAGAEDAQVLARAAIDGRVVVTEDVGDFVPLLDTGTASGQPVPPVVIALKRNLPTGAGAMTHGLVSRLTTWADEHPTPYPHVHWLV